MNRKIILILSLVILAAFCVSIATAVNDTDQLSQNDTDDNITADESDFELVGDDAKDDIKISTEISDKEDKLSDEGGISKIITDLPIKAVWKDNNNSDGKRPSEITCYLKEKGNNLVTTTLIKDNNWETHLSEVLANPSDLSIEGEAVDGYTIETSGDADSGFVITYTLKKSDDDKKQDNSTNDDKNQTGDTNKTVETPEKDPKDQKKITTVTKTKVTTKDDKKPKEKNKDEHNTGNPILLGVLAVSALGLAYQFRRKE